MKTNLEKNFGQNNLSKKNVKKCKSQKSFGPKKILPGRNQIQYFFGDFE